MERSRHGQRQSTLGSIGFEHGASLFHSRFGAGNDCLHGIVEVDRLHNLTRIRGKRGLRLGTPGNHAFSGHTQNSGHCAHAHRHRLLHGGSPKAHQRRGMGQRQHASSHQRRVFTQRMPGHHIGQAPALGQPGTVSGHTGHQHHWLGVGGQRQGFFGALLNELSDIFTQSIGSLGQCGQHSGMVSPCIKHADSLRALSWKNKCK